MIRIVEIMLMDFYESMYFMELDCDSINLNKRVSGHGGTNVNWIMWLTKDKNAIWRRNIIIFDDFRYMKFIYLHCGEEIKLRDPSS